MYRMNNPYEYQTDLGGYNSEMNNIINARAERLAAMLQDRDDGEIAPVWGQKTDWGTFFQIMESWHEKIGCDWPLGDTFEHGHWKPRQDVKVWLELTSNIENKIFKN